MEKSCTVGINLRPLSHWLRIGSTMTSFKTLSDSSVTYLSKLEVDYCSFALMSTFHFRLCGKGRKSVFFSLILCYVSVCFSSLLFVLIEVHLCSISDKSCRFFMQLLQVTKEVYCVPKTFAFGPGRHIAFSKFRYFYALIKRTRLLDSFIFFTWSCGIYNLVDLSTISQTEDELVPWYV